MVYSTEPLSTQRYWQAHQQEELKATRRDRNQKAIQDFTTFLLGLGAMAVGVHLAEHQHQWLPVLQSWLARWL